MTRRVEGIFLAPAEEAPAAPVGEVEAVAGKGLRGDRHFYPEGAREGAAITLIEAEAVEGLARDDGIELGPGEHRRQVVTRGVDLNALVGRVFRVGEVECRGVEPCEPCRHLERLTRPGVLRGLVHRGGLRADILAGGTIRVGDPVGARDAGDRAS